MSKYERHIFICTNRRAEDNPKGCCARKGASEIRDVFKEAVFKAGLKGKVRANQAGCLDACAFGPTVVVYPEGIWYSVSSPEDAVEIVEKHLVKGEIVEHLLIPRTWAKG